MYLVAPSNISLFDFSNTFGSKPPCKTTFVNFSFAHIGFILGSKFKPSGFTKSLNSLYCSFIPLGKQIVGIFLFLQNSTNFAFGSKQYSLIFSSGISPAQESKICTTSAPAFI